MRVPGIKYVQGRNSYSPSTKYAIAIHNTSNDASAANEASYATRRTDGTSSHFYVDEKEIIQSLDTVNRAGHAGSTNGNRNAIAVEVTGVNSKTRQWWLDNVNWKQLAYALATVCRAHGIPVRRVSVAEMKANPQVRGFYSHNDMRLAWGGTTHTDPGDNFPWDKLLAEVAVALSGPSEGEAVVADSEFHVGAANGPFLTQGNPGFAGQQRDTALAFAWQASAEAKEVAEQVLAIVKELKTELALVKADVAELKAREVPAPGGITNVGTLYVDVKPRSEDPSIQKAL